MPNSFWNHPVATLEHALDLRKRIDTLKQSLNDILGGGASSVKAKIDGRKGKRSAASRAKMAAAQKARWAKKRGASTKTASVAPAAKAPKKKKRTMSPEARARIAAAQRARWAKSRK